MPEFNNATYQTVELPKKLVDDIGGIRGGGEDLIFQPFMTRRLTCRQWPGWRISPILFMVCHIIPCLLRLS